MQKCEWCGKKVEQLVDDECCSDECALELKAEREEAQYQEMGWY